MTKLTIHYLLLAGLLSLLSCLSNEKDLFPESAAWRLNNAIDNARQVLINPSNQNGWVMEYFPTNHTEGYTFLMNFDANTFVTVAARNKYTPVYTTDQSAYDVIGDNGPVLTFNTYNKVFHLFSNPENPNGSSDLDGIGLMGDYEFIILSATNDEIMLKGKKRGTAIRMHPLARGQDWKGYFDRLDAMDKALFNPNLPVTLTLTTNDNDSLYYLTNGATHIFEAKSRSQIDAGDQGANVPFIITDSGIRFAQPFIMGSDSVRTFQLSDDKTRLVCIDKGVQAAIAGEELASLFLRIPTAFWVFDSSAVSDKVAGMYNRIVNSCIQIYQAESVTMGIGYSASRNTFEWRLQFVRNGGKQTVTGNLSLTASSSESASEVSFQATGTGDNNGMTFASRIDGYQEMAELLSQPFLLSTDVAINPTNMKFMQVGGTEVWFLAVCQ